MMIVEKYIIPLLLGITMMIVSGAIALWVSVKDLTSVVNQHDQEIKTIRQELHDARTSLVTRSELLETLKRVEQQLEIVMLKAKITGKIKLSEE